MRNTTIYGDDQAAPGHHASAAFAGRRSGVPLMNKHVKPPPPSSCGIESGARILIHARNNRGSLRAVIRAAIHADIAKLREMRT